MRTKSDLTIPFVIIGYSCLFTIPLLLRFGLNLTIFGWLWISFWSLVAISGIWKIESFEVNDNILIKRNFLGTFSRKWDLHFLIKYSKKTLHTDLPTNPFNIIRLFTKPTKYLTFSQIKLEFSNGTTVKVDERTMDSADYLIFYKQLKKTHCIIKQQIFC